MIKTLALHIKGFVLESVLTPLFMILEVVMETIIPMLMATIIDDGINKGDMQHIIITGLWMLLCALIALFAGAMGAVYGAKASAGFAKNLRQGMFENIQSFSFANIDKYSTAGLVTRMTTDVTNVQNAYMMLLRICFRAPVNLIAAMTMTFLINARLASIYLIAVVFLGISSIRVVKAFVREEHEVKKFHKAANNLYKLFVKAEKLMVSVTPLMTLTVYGSVIAISWFGAVMIVKSELTTGELTTMLTYCMQILMSLMMVGFIFVMLTMSMASAQRIAGVLNEKSTLTNPENPDFDVPDGSIDFENVSFSYSEKSERPVLNDINLHIRSGETIGIAGGTGSSKTSLVNLIGRLYDASEGCVKVGGKDVRSYDLETLTISAGATSTPPRRSVSRRAGWHAPTSSFRTSPTATTPESNRAARTSRADRSSAFVSRERFSKSPRY